MPQYIEETEQILHELMNGHRATIKGAKTIFLAEYFRTKEHSLSDFSIQIIEHFQCIGKKTDKERRLTWELFWEMKLCTVFTYGDLVSGIGSVSQSHNNIHPGILFYKLKCERHCHGYCRSENVSHLFNIDINLIVWLTWLTVV